MVAGELRREDLAALNAYLIRGRNYRQVYEETGVTRARLNRLLEREDVKEILNKKRQEFQDQLDTMQDMVLDNLRDLLKHSNAKVRLEAIDRWARMNGRNKDNLNLTKEISAEDVAKSLLNEGDDERA